MTLLLSCVESGDIVEQEFTKKHELLYIFVAKVKKEVRN